MVSEVSRSDRRVNESGALRVSGLVRSDEYASLSTKISADEGLAKHHNKDWSVIRS